MIDFLPELPTSGVSFSIEFLHYHMRSHRWCPVFLQFPWECQGGGVAFSVAFPSTDISVPKGGVAALIDFLTMSQGVVQHLHVLSSVWNRSSLRGGVALLIDFPHDFLRVV